MAEKIPQLRFIGGADIHASAISADDYDLDIKERLETDSLELQKPYVFKGQLKGRAAKALYTNVSIESIQRSHQLTVFQLNFLNSDFQPAYTAEGYIGDDFWIAQNKRLKVRRGIFRAILVEGYLLDSKDNGIDRFVEDYADLGPMSLIS